MTGVTMRRAIRTRISCSTAPSRKVSRCSSPAITSAAAVRASTLPGRSPSGASAPISAGNPNPDFVLNRPESQGVEVLLAGDNFGCGSSREHAPWALTQWGFRAVISTSFADIFQQNSLKNSLLPIIVPPDVHAELFAAAPGAIVKIDLPNQTLTTRDGRVVKFPVDAFSKHCLVKGVDELGYILDQSPEIAAYEAAHPAPINPLA